MGIKLWLKFLAIQSQRWLKGGNNWKWFRRRGITKRLSKENRVFDLKIETKFETNFKPKKWQYFNGNAYLCPPLRPALMAPLFL